MFLVITRKRFSRYRVPPNSSLKPVGRTLLQTRNRSFIYGFESHRDRVQYGEWWQTTVTREALPLHYTAIAGDARFV